jgi:hypothetical protein
MPITLIEYINIKDIYCIACYTDETTSFIRNILPKINKQNPELKFIIACKDCQNGEINLFDLENIVAEKKVGHVFNCYNLNDVNFLL